MEEKTIPQIICALLRDADVMPFMPEVWRDGCGAVFLTGEVKREAYYESVGFELAVRCNDTSADVSRAINTLKTAERYFETCDVECGGVRGYVAPHNGVRRTYADKSGAAEYRASYCLVRERASLSSAHTYYVNTGRREAPVWSEVKEGFFQFGEKTDGEVFERRYLHERTSRRDVVERSVEITFEVRYGYSSPAALKLCEISDEIYSGGDGKIEVLSVSAREDENFPGAPVAVRREYAVLPEGGCAERGRLTLTGKLLACGDGVQGRLVKSTGIFTAER